MKKCVLMAILAFGCTFLGAQSLKFETSIKKTGVITDDGVEIEASSDDAEQENDAIDSLFDDDIDAGWEGEADDQNILTAGLRFRDVYIPKGSTIDSAYFVLYSHEGKSAEDVARLTIYGELTGNAETFTEDALITDRPSTMDTVLWEVAEEWEIYQPYRTTDVSAIVQEIIGLDDWVAGNAMAFVFRGENQGPSELENAREWEAFENIADPEDGGDGQNHPERIPRFVVYFTPPEGSLFQQRILGTGEVTDDGETFEASTDDAEQENDEIDTLFDDDIDAGWEGEATDQNILTAGMRFQNVPVAQGAQIEAAFINVWSHEAKEVDDVARLTIYGEATDNAETFTEDALITDRPATEASILWLVNQEWGLYSQEQTPDLTPIVQEIVNRDGWQPGNAMAFVFRGENQGPSEVENAREWEAFENIADPADGGDGQNHPERVPLLTIVTQGLSTSVFTAAGQAESLHIFPNPTNKGMVTLNFSHDAAADIRLFNAKGQLLQSLKSTFGQAVTVDVSQLTAGIYFFQALQNGVFYADKLIIKD